MSASVAAGSALEALSVAQDGDRDEVAVALAEKLATLDLDGDELAELDRLLRHAASYEAPDDLMVIDGDLVDAAVQQAVITRTAHALRCSHRVAAEAFADALEFVGASQRYVARMVPSYQVDEAWHQFILFTADYERYCRLRVGRFVHHAPFLPSRAGAGDDALAPEETLALLLRHGHPMHPERWRPRPTADAIRQLGH